MAKVGTGQSCPPVQYSPSIVLQGCTAGTEQPHAPDAIAYASQLGRLDFVSAILAALGVIIAGSSAIAYLEFRVRVTKVARKTAREEALEETRKLVPVEARRALVEWQNEFGDTFRSPRGGSDQELQDALSEGDETDDNDKA